jgi:hypothetical protein
MSIGHFWEILRVEDKAECPLRQIGLTTVDVGARGDLGDPAPGPGAQAHEEQGFREDHFLEPARRA